MYQVISPSDEQQWETYYDLRYRVLREPFQRPRGSEKDEYDQVGYHRMVVNDAGVAVAVGRLHFNSPDEGQIRFMASAPEHRGEDTGSPSSLRSNNWRGKKVQSTLSLTPAITRLASTKSAVTNWLKKPTR